MKFFCFGIKDVLKILDSNENDLSIKCVEERLKTNGKNRLSETKKQSKLSKFLNEFKDLMIIFL